MRRTRRDFLQLAGGAGLVGATAGLGFLRFGPSPQTGTLLRSALPLPAPFEVALPIPPVARPRGGGDRYEIVQRAADLEILPGRTTTIWGYDGVFPGPTIRARRGRAVEVRFVNELAVPTVVHLHGGRTPPGSDGYPTDLVLPPGDSGAGSRMRGETTERRRLHRYPLDQRAATLWYHDHAMDFTAPNVYRGLAGFFVVSDDEEDDLPLPRGERDVPLMICDRGFDADGGLRYPALSPEQHRPGVQERYMGGVLADVILVNGAPWPTHEVSRTRHRLRLLNASNARRYELALDSSSPAGSSLTQIGTDGGLLDAPIERATITLAPAERADVLVDFSAYRLGTRVVLANRLGDGSTSRVMAFDVVREEPDDTTVPARLTTLERLDPARATITRRFAFTLRNHDGMLHWMVAGRRFDPGHDHARPRLGDVEIWQLMTDVHHPIHIHLAPFQVLNRNGDADLAPGDRGWKDTLDLLPGQTAEIAIRFDGFRGRYVFHCHNLEHEDMAMMANFTVS